MALGSRCRAFTRSSCPENGERCVSVIRRSGDSRQKILYPSSLVVAVMTRVVGVPSWFCTHSRKSVSGSTTRMICGFCIKRSEAAVTALPFIELGNGRAQVVFAKVGPELLGHVNLGVAQLPQKKV